MSSEVIQAIKDQVAAIPDLTDAQRTSVIDIAVAYVEKHSGQMPSIYGIVRHVRGQR